MLNKTKIKGEGSILVYSLVVLSIILVGALAISAAGIIVRKTSGTTAKSTQAFQVADSGVEEMLKIIEKDGHKTLADVDADAHLPAGWSHCDVATGVIKGNVGGGSAEITFKDASDVAITSCTDSTTQIASIKSVGSYSGTSRAVEVAVAASPGYHYNTAETCSALTTNGSYKSYSYPTGANAIPPSALGVIVTFTGLSISGGGFEAHYRAYNGDTDRWAVYNYGRTMPDDVSGDVNTVILPYNSSGYVEAKGLKVGNASGQICFEGYVD